MPELTQTVSPLGSQSQTVTPGGAAARPVISQTFSPSGDKTSVKAEGGPTIEQTVSQGGAPGGRMLSESTRTMLANLDKYGSVLAPKAEESSPAAPDSGSAGSAPAPQPEAPSGAAAATPAKPDEPAPTDEHRVRADRLEAKNRELVAEVERYKATPAKHEPSAREKALDEAERSYLDDPIGALRRIIATAIGADDPKHADVDAELSGLYKDLTAKELGIQLDAAEVARRESLRTKHMVARDRRERSAAAATPAAPAEAPEAQRDAQHTQLIASRLADKAVSDAFPLTLKLAERLHGSKPEALVLRVIREGFATGEFDPQETDHKLIEQAARKIETHYQDLAKILGGASTSTASTPTADARANQDTAQKQASPTITNASASVAPATSPAKQPDPPAKKYKSEHERRLEIARKHLRD